MIKLINFILLVFFYFCSYSQDKATVENSIFGVQIGFSGINLHSELKLFNNIVLRPEIAYEYDYSYSSSYSFSNYLFFPRIEIGSKFYYNLDKRFENGKSIYHNSANFLSIKFEYNPNFLIISDSNVNVFNRVGLLPNWGLRRNINSKFNYEFACGYIFSYFPEFYKDNFETSGVYIDFKIGYKFM